MGKFEKGLSRKKFKAMTRALEAFHGGLLQDFDVLLDVLEMNGYSVEDFRKFFKHLKRKNIIAEKMRNKKSRMAPIRCPQCEISFVSIFPANMKKCDQVGGDYRSQLACGDWKHCGWEMFSKKTVKQWQYHISTVGPVRAFELPDDLMPPKGWRPGVGSTGFKETGCGGKKNEESAPCGGCGKS